MTKRIESKTSRTAEFTCMVRCLSYLEKRPQYKSDDYVSLIIMNSLIKFFIKFPVIKRCMINNFVSGMYEYVISRTKYIDEKVRAALLDGTEQILILGAGFDSRGIRFRDTANRAKIFELDAPATQNAKIERYKEKGVNIPNNLIFIPIDFDKQSISDRLSECGFKRGKKSLIVMEGLTMYLQPESIDNLFNILNDFTGEGSKIVWLEKENVAEFLAQYGFEILDISDSSALEDRFFRNGNGKRQTTVNGAHCIMTASKR
jgi:methyltransferase (TIGR00027 family)